MSFRNEDIRIVEVASRLESAVATNDLKSIGAILSGDNLDDIKIEDIKFHDIFSQATLLLLKYGTNVRLHEKAILNLGEGKIKFVIKECSNSIGLTGIIKINDKIYSGLEGRNEFDSLLTLKESVNHYADNNKYFTEINDAINFTCAVKKEDTKGDIDSSTVQFSNYFKGQLAITNVGWLGHGLGMALIFDKKKGKTYIALTNRGDEGLAVCAANQEAEQLLLETGEGEVYGTIIYELDGTMNSDFFNDFGGINQKSHQDFKKILKSYLAAAKPLIVLPAGPQGYGNCTYANPRRSIEGALFILSLVAGMPLDSKTMEIAFDRYKKFSLQDKYLACENIINFINNYKTQPGADPIAIQAIYQLMAKIVISHCDKKEYGSELIYIRHVFMALPEETKDKLRKILPDEVISNNVHLQVQHGFFSRDNKADRKIRIKGNYDDIAGNIDSLSEVIQLTKEYSRKDIPSILVEDKYIFINLTNSGKGHANNIVDSLSRRFGKDKIGYIQDDIISVSVSNKHEDKISDESIADRLKYSGINFTIGTDLMSDLHMSKKDTEELINNAESAPIIRRSEDESMQNFIVLSFFGPKRGKAVHLQFECERTEDGGVIIKDAHNLISIYNRYNPTSQPRNI